MKKFVRVKRKFRRLFRWKVYETEEREEISPIPDYRREETMNHTLARLSTPGILGFSNVEVEKEKKTSKNEEWNQKRQTRVEKKDSKRDKED